MALGEPPRRSEPLGDAVRRTPAKKDRKRWCGGHVGREHVLEVTLASYVSHRESPCHASEVKHWVTYATYKQWESTGDWYWSCYHIIRCSTCGRHMESVKPERCPTRGTDK